MENLVLIDNDLFDISSRLRQINDGYIVYYNVLKSRFEVHNKNQHGNTLAFVVPYDELDARTVELAQYSRVERAEKIFADTDKCNDKVATISKENLLN